MNVSLYTGKLTESESTEGYPEALLSDIFGKHDNYSAALASNASEDHSKYPDSVICDGRAVIRSSVNSNIIAEFNDKEHAVPYIDVFLISKGVTFKINGVKYAPKTVNGPIVDNEAANESTEEAKATLEEHSAPLVLGNRIDEDRIIEFVSSVINVCDKDKLISDLAKHCIHYNCEPSSSKAAEIKAIEERFMARRILFCSAYALLLSYYKNSYIPDPCYAIPIVNKAARRVSFVDKTPDEIYAILELSVDDLYRREAPELKRFAKDLFQPYGSRRGIDIIIANFKISKKHPINDKINKLAGGV